MIAVTGAGGKTGRAILQALAQRGVAMRALVHRASDGAKVAVAGATEWLVGEMSDVATLERLLQGAVALYHICPNMHPHEAEIGARVVACAQRAKVQHLVYHSVLHPQTAAMPHHWQKMLVEDQLFASGLPFTILQPTAYMQNLLPYAESVRREGVYRVPYPVSIRIALVDLRDVAEVAARVLTESGHTDATYELVGTLPLSQLEVAETWATQWEQNVQAEELSLEAWEREARQSSLGDYAIQTLRQMFRYYAAYGLVGNANVLRWLLGRAPTTLAEFLSDVLDGGD
jgi:uncharacterized protein YbjT (DUF2867 family)